MGDVFRLNEPQVACENLEGDLIFVNFESGLYYNVRGTGADICQYLIAGGSLGQTISQLAMQVQSPPSEVERDVREFVDGLCKDGLLVPSESLPLETPMKVSASRYAPPQCQKFDDMADQLLLDKIDDQSKDAQWATPSGETP